ncbi:MAG: response regulator [Ignavibacteria bacterium]|jgi:signal transduction histidine kinase/CheY-like chemotaxis protein|nr:response regulator [Ignavibacteria bacterium]MCU7514474.1 response regulator [Ignavibacteria bacterium]MCU7522314.1 response regulator [Ignavibacteria bacterium]MCU7525557.1 response regulator [Ignavibacteria bacterium]
MSVKIITLRIKYEEDTVLARQRARQIASLLGFDTREQTAIATSVSELVRNAFNYARGGIVEFSIDGKPEAQKLSIKISDDGPGISNLEDILAGHYRSETGMGLGIVGTRRLMDSFDIKCTPGKGTTVIIGKKIPNIKAPIGPDAIRRITDELIKKEPQSPIEEFQMQNQELLRTLEEIKRRQEELERLNLELEETNRGVVALYAELDEKAEHLQRINDAKARFLSNMSHEFKTPLNSIIALVRLLQEHVDGDLNEEQEKQVSYIRRSAEDLTELVSDLLDIAKVESGKTTVKPVEFAVSDLFSALRGMLRPLQTNPAVSLVFEDPVEIPLMFNDEAKISQVLRNFISNALKFTVKGEVRVKAERSDNGEYVIFSVADTGIGIAPKDQELIFEEFSQVESELQKKAKGTGLGLPLSKKLTELLGGNVYLKSKPGEGSTFFARFPAGLSYTRGEKTGDREIVFEQAPENSTVLIIEDNEAMHLIYDKYLKGTGFKVKSARSIDEARTALEQTMPDVIILDILLPGENTWKFLTELKSNTSYKDIPVLVASVIDEEERGLALGADDYCVKPVERQWLLKKLQNLKSRRKNARILIIDDEAIARYILKEMLPQGRFEVIEAENGKSGLEKAVNYKPDIIFLDLIMPDSTGFEILEKLKADPGTRDIPVVINTSKDMDAIEIARLNRSAAAVLGKKDISKARMASQIRDILLKTVKDGKGKKE